MGKKITPENNCANMQNPNKGSDGTNKQFDKAQGNRGKQMNPNRKKQSWFCSLGLETIKKIPILILLMLIF